MTAQDSRFDVLGQLVVLRRYARSLTHNDDEAEDLVHDTLVRAYERRASFQPGRNLRVWLLSILYRLFIDEGRARRAEARRIARAGELLDPHLPAGQDHHVRLGQIRRVFMTLPEDQRAALHLVAIEGLRYAEAAAALEIPIGTLMSRLARARATIRAAEETGELAGLAGGRHLKIVGGTDS